MSVTVLVKQWGCNLGIRLPTAVAREANLHVHQRVRITVESGQVVIKPFEDTCLTLEQCVAAYDVKRHGGEQMTTTAAVGTEKW